jgi:NagD protein
MNNLQRLRLIRHVALDMDGTIYKGGTLFPFTIPFLERMRALGIGTTFLTNNSSKSVDHYLAHLGKMGIRADRDQMYTSSLATIDYLAETFPAVKRLFVLGTVSLRDEFAAAGFRVVSGEEEPEAVVVGFDTALDYERLCKAAHCHAPRLHLPDRSSHGAGGLRRCVRAA